MTSEPLSSDANYCECGHSSNDHCPRACIHEDCDCGTYRPDARPESAEQYPVTNDPKPKAAIRTSKNRVHELKTWPEFFARIEDGTKTFELRKDDRGFRAGDTLVLREWNPRMKTYTGNELRRVVTYLMCGPPFGLMKDWVAMGLAPETVSTPDAWMVLGEDGWRYLSGGEGDARQRMHSPTDKLYPLYRGELKVEICPWKGIPKDECRKCRESMEHAQKASGLPLCNCHEHECHGVEEASANAHRCRKYGEGSQT